MTADTLCAVCRKPLSLEHRFCLHCGAEVSTPAPTPDLLPPAVASAARPSLLQGVKNLGKRFSGAGTKLRKKAEAATELMVALPVATDPNLTTTPARKPRTIRAEHVVVGAVVVLGAVAVWWALARSPAPPGALADVQPEAPVATPVTSPAQLVLTGVPLGATITVDGESRTGGTFELAAGTHVIRVSAADYATTIDTVTLVAGERTELPIDARPLDSRF